MSPLPTTGPVWAIIPAGGSGQRFLAQAQSSGDLAPNNKLLADLAGQPVLARTVQALLEIPMVCGLVIAGAAEALATYQNLVTPIIQDRQPQVDLSVVQGGETRRASVFQALCQVPDEIHTVLIHDAARPLLNSAEVLPLIAHVQAHGGGAVVGAPVTDTVKQIHPNALSQSPPEILTTLDRQTLWTVQTPQVFCRKTLLAAHQQVPPNAPITDDAQLLELASLGPVALFEGSRWNLKITTPDDLALATWWLFNANG
jgi:2-C-methyl-D-erythritol 4-phosphate cytidylyltransferase